MSRRRVTREREYASAAAFGRAVVEELDELHARPVLLGERRHIVERGEAMLLLRVDRVALLQEALCLGHIARDCPEPQREQKIFKLATLSSASALMVPFRPWHRTSSTR